VTAGASDSVVLLTPVGLTDVLIITVVDVDDFCESVCHVAI